MAKETQKKSNAPLFIIGAVLVVAVVVALWAARSPAPTSTSTNAPRNTAQQPRKTATMPPNAPSGATPARETGSPSATVVLEEFADFQCGSCAQVHPIMNEIKSMYGSKIRFVFRHFPLRMHDKAYDAAAAAEAAGLQGKFWEMQNLLFNNQRSWSADPNYKQTWAGYARTIGLDVTKWETDMAGMATRARVEEDLKRGNAAGIDGTPALYLNGTMVNINDMNIQALSSMIDAELQKASQPSVPNAPANAAPANK